MTPRSTPVYCIALVLIFIGFSLATPRPAVSAPEIQPEADQVLRDMSAYLAGLSSFAVELDTMVDFVLDSGQKIQLDHHRSIKVSRPNRMVAEVDGDDVHRKLWYNGETVTFLDADHNVYAVAPAPDTITGMIRFVEKKLEIHVPLGDLLAEDPYADLTRNVETGVYLGLHRVGNRKCHHLAFTQDNVDWQIWIDAEGSPVPRKVVITYKKQPSQPQYIAIIRKWDDAVEFPADEFEFTPPAGATEVEFMLPEQTSVPATGGAEQ